MPFHLNVCDAFDDGGSGIVDAVEHRLIESSSLTRGNKQKNEAYLELYHRGNMKKALRAVQNRFEETLKTIKVVADRRMI